MQNRIEITFQEKDYAKTVQTATEIVGLINVNVPEIKNDDRKGGQNMGEGNGWKFAKKAYEIVTDDRALVHVDLLDYDAFKRNIVATTKLLDLKAILGGWIGNMGDAFVALSRDLMMQSNAVLTALKPLSKTKKAYKVLYDELNFLYSTRAAKAAATIEQNNRVADLEKQVSEFKEAAVKKA